MILQDQFFLEHILIFKIKSNYNNSGRKVVNPTINPKKTPVNKLKNAFLMWTIFSVIISQMLTKISLKQINEANVNI